MKNILKNNILIFSLFPLFAFANENLPLNKLQLPEGFSISVFASDVQGARSLALGDKGTIFVGSIHAGKVYAIVTDEKNKKQVITIASDLTMPNGVTFYNGSLYVAERHRILRFDNIESYLVNPPKPIVISQALPDKKHHDWRYLKIGPDKKLYVSIGAPCNTCLEKDERFATIARMDLDGNHFEIYAKGIRNSVGFDWNPIDEKLWFTDNSRDWMGDDTPPEELNYAPQQHLNFGFPYCHGKTISDPDFGKKIPCNNFTPPVFEMPAHVAPLGMTFYTGKNFPQTYHNQIFIAEHGSWNRSTKVGYQVISVKIKDNKVVAAKPFITGWLQNEKAWGRPVDVLVMPDGTMLISDDHANVIYKVSYH